MTFLHSVVRAWMARHQITEFLYISLPDWYENTSPDIFEIRIGSHAIQVRFFYSDLRIFDKGVDLTRSEQKQIANKVERHLDASLLLPLKNTTVPNAAKTLANMPWHDTKTKRKMPWQIDISKEPKSKKSLDALIAEFKAAK